MRLAAIYLEGFKRFKEKQKLLIDGRLTCILGPNEAGKTSVLDALVRLNDRSAFKNEGPERETYRSSVYSPGHVILTALYQIEKEDREVLEYVEGAEALRWFEVNRRVDGAESIRIVPSIEVSNLRREKIISLLTNSPTWPQWLTDAVLSSKDLEGTIDNLRQLVDYEAERVSPPSLVEAIEAVVKEIDAEAFPEASGFIREAGLMLRYEKLTAPPEDEVIRVLSARRPHFVMFTPNDLQLRSDYDLNAFYREKNPEGIPKALTNFAKLAGLDLRQAFEFARTNDTGSQESFEEEINRNLSTRLSQAWLQSKLEVRIRFDRTLMSINVRNDANRFEKIAARSEGLRQFVALVAFIYNSREGKREPVLLIDEVEQHLHYDAQADLVQMLTTQKVVRQIIYTTHSIGCLPEDLGCGVRVLKLDAEKSGTKVVNHFWEDESPGLSPLLVGMGAATMAFLPTRDCALTEGAADFLLLPSLMREATGKDALALQFSPGLSVADRAQLKVLQTNGKHVLHVVDGDSGGREIKGQLRGIGIPEEEIFDLSNIDGENLVVEDLISPVAYCCALNAELERSGHALRFDAADLPEKLRPNYVKEKCLAAGISVPSKVSVAYRLLDEKHTLPILDRKYAEALARMYEKMMKRQKA